SAGYGLVRGFDSCDKAWSSGSGGRQFTFMYRMIDQLGLGGVDDKGGSTVVGNIERWMDERPDDARPAFVFVNFLEAHFPFEQLPDEYLYAFHDRPFQELKAAGLYAVGIQFGRQITDAEYEKIKGPIRDMYDGGVLYTDALVGRVLDVWRGRGLLDDTVVVVLADHGEVVGEHRAFGHLAAVVEEDLRVPMVVRYPPKVPAGEVVSHPISTTGALATVTALAGVETPETVLVGNLMEALDDPEAGKPVIAERYEKHLLVEQFEPGTTNGVGPLVNPRGRYRTYRSGPYKLVQHSEDGTFLFHLELGEDRDLASEQPEKVSALEQELLQISLELGLPSLGVEVQQVARAEQTDEEILSLCQLGYLEGLICDCARGNKSGPECDCARGRAGAECP
ncbi:MAG TPA: DUF229 domain-containing protein, partial [Deltaproteobacteria bacterium]|nr:DUF229 domain-containing protein [Deltaproteobacteria bacterium]